MGWQTILEAIADEKLLDMDIAYIAKVISYSNGIATVQPLNMIKQYGEKAKMPSIVSDIPVLESARYKMKPAEISFVSNVTANTTQSQGYVTSVSLNVEKDKMQVLTPTELTAGDLVFCVCADRDITEARRGNMSTPSLGHHNKSDSVVVGIL